MTHYICVGGCKGVSETPGVCQAKDCPEHSHPLKECDCADGEHYGDFPPDRTTSVGRAGGGAEATQENEKSGDEAGE